jgi:Domain of unknown function (DUF4124)
MRRLIILTGMAAMALAASVGAATLNKCIDAQGKITYSNLPCHNAREARTVEVDPAPPLDPLRSMPARAQPAKAASAKPAANADEPAAIQLETRRAPTGINTSGKPVARTAARQCDTLTEKLGRVFDKMDQARRNGYTQKQMDEWNQEIKDLERKKQQSGCF